jgi:hypothetical protein
LNSHEGCRDRHEGDRKPRRTFVFRHDDSPLQPAHSKARGTVTHPKKQVNKALLHDIYTHGKEELRKSSKTRGQGFCRRISSRCRRARSSYHLVLGAKDFYSYREAGKLADRAGGER